MLMLLLSMPCLIFNLFLLISNLKNDGGALNIAINITAVIFTIIAALRSLETL